MSFIVVIFLFISACFHISWNYLTKESAKDCKSWLIIALILAFITSPFLFFYREHIPYLIKHWPLILVSGFFEAIQVWAFVVAYRNGDLSFVYPLKNAIPIFLTAIYSIILGEGSNITGFAYIGFFLIILGCLIIPVTNVKDIKLSNYINKPFLYTCLAALGTSVYSYIDSYVAKSVVAADPSIGKIGVALLYLPFLYCSIAIMLIPFLFIDKITFKVDFRNVKINWKTIFLISIFTCAAYTLILFSYNYATNVSYVVAFRQIGMPMSFIVGAVFLKEKIYFGKTLGIIIILAGLVLTAIF
ncbi:MAG: EamA family transporter [Abditibacteriota bacterium]|nr:EamA family transporter [Abditibacteriota bacterium]